MDTKGGILDTKGGSYLNIIVGIWLFISTFLWRHSPAQFSNTWIMGVIVAGVAALALVWPTIRYLNTLAGTWLSISAFALPTIAAGTRWNNFLVGIIVVTLSLAGAEGINLPARRPHRLQP
jgi:hypothetical protein